MRKREGAEEGEREGEREGEGEGEGEGEAGREGRGAGGGGPGVRGRLLAGEEGRNAMVVGDGVEEVEQYDDDRHQLREGSEESSVRGPDVRVLACPREPSVHVHVPSVHVHVPSVQIRLLPQMQRNKIRPARCAIR